MMKVTIKDGTIVRIIGGNHNVFISPAYPAYPAPAYNAQLGVPPPTFSGKVVRVNEKEYPPSAGEESPALLDYLTSFNENGTFGRLA